jgi:type I restriction enzyme M protein
LFDREVEAKRAVKDAQTVLELAVFAQYPKLITDEVKSLVVHDKWQTALEQSIQAEIERVTQQLAGRVKVLEERYAEPLPQLIQEVEVLAGKVDDHLKRMALVWGS